MCVYIIIYRQKLINNQNMHTYMYTIKEYETTISSIVNTKQPQNEHYIIILKDEMRQGRKKWTYR